MIQDKTVGQTIQEIETLGKRYLELQKSLILRAQLQEVTEIDYKNLVEVMKEGI